MDPGDGSPAANAAGYLWQTQAVLKSLDRTLHQLCTQTAYHGDMDSSISKLRLHLASAAATFSEDCMRDLLGLASSINSWCDDPTSRLSYRRCRSALTSLQYSARQEHLRVVLKRVRRECSSENICGVRGAATVRCVLSLASKLEEHIADIIESYSALLNPVPFVDTEWPVSSNQAVAACSSSSSRRGPACAPCGGSSFNYTSKHGLRQLQDACCAFLEVCQPLKGQLAAYEGLAVHLEAQQTAATAEAAAAVADAEQRAVELPKKSTSLFRHQFCFFLLVAVILNAGTGMAVYYVCKSHQGAAARAIVEQAVAQYAAQAEKAIATMDAENKAQLSAARSHIKQLEAELEHIRMETHLLQAEVHNLTLVVSYGLAKVSSIKAWSQDSRREICNARREVGKLRAGFTELRKRMVCESNMWMAWTQSARRNIKLIL